MSTKKVIDSTLTPPKSAGGRQSRVSGPIPAKVIKNDDPEQRYRVKVVIKTPDGPKELPWARIATPLAGNGYGAFFLPEVDDEVLIDFVAGDPEQPVVIGALWNGGNRLPPADFDASADDVNHKVANNAQGGENNFRFIKSRAGHTVLMGDTEGAGFLSIRTAKRAELHLDDTDGGERIQLYDGDRQQWLEIDVPNKKITLQTDTGELLIKAKTHITLDAAENLTLNAGKDLKISAGINYELKARGTIKQASGGDTETTAASNMTIKGAKIDLNP